ncbi:MAG: GEVED domain-containing protein, partial [Bacteroidota bacterium]
MKKFYNQIKSIKKFKIVLFNLIAVCLFFSLNAQTQQFPWEANNNNFIREDFSARNVHTKTFLRNDGTKSAFVASLPIHFNEGGQWKDIKNEILSNTTGAYPDYPYSNTENSIKTFFPSNPFVDPILSRYNGLEIKEQITSIDFVNQSGNTISSLQLDRNSVTVSVHNNTIKYSGFFPGVNLIYTTSNTGRKFDLEISSSNFINNIPQNATKLVIRENIFSGSSSTTLVSSENGLNLNYNGETVIQYAVPMAYDENFANEYSKQASILDFKNVAGTIVFNSAFDCSWIKNPRRVFPIHLDPVANYLPVLTLNWTGYQTSSTAKTSGYLRITGNTTASWSKYDLTAIPAGATIAFATYYGNHYTGSGNTTAKFCRLRHMTSDPVPAVAATLWNESNNGTIITADFNWANAAIYGWKSAPFNAAGVANVQTALAQGWYAAGTQWASGGTSFSYHYGVNGTSTTCTYLEIDYSTGPCSGTPNAGVANITLATGCPSVNFTLSVSGLSTGSGQTYQWQSATSSTGPWTDIVGANSPTYSTSVSNTTFYQLITTCTNSGISSTSNAVSYTVNNPGPCICAGYQFFAATSTADEDIGNVTVGSMNNTTTCASLSTGAGSLLNRYNNYTGIITPTSEQVGSTVNFSLSSITCGGNFGNGFQIYIDYNQNGSFADPGEQVYSSPASVTGPHTETGSFVIPLTATLGTTRMRVVNVETTFPTATNYAGTNYTWGETEDYCFDIIAATNCTGTPSGGNSAISL